MREVFLFIFFIKQSKSDLLINVLCDENRGEVLKTLSKLWSPAPKNKQGLEWIWLLYWIDTAIMLIAVLITELVNR